VQQNKPTTSIKTKKEREKQHNKKVTMMCCMEIKPSPPAAYPSIAHPKSLQRGGAGENKLTIVPI
jgi:hypothetical protein